MFDDRNQNFEYLFVSVNDDDGVKIWGRWEYDIFAGY